jgi:hypothetical protein
MTAATSSKIRFIALPMLSGARIDTIIVNNPTIVPGLGHAIEMRDTAGFFHRMFVRSIVWHLTPEEIEATVYVSESKWRGPEHKDQS